MRTKQLPQVVQPRKLIDWRMSTLVNNQYVPARPVPFYHNPVKNTWTRIKLAVGVLTGKYDALDWEY